MEAELAIAQARYQAEPESEPNIIWLGRRLAYLGRIHEAIDTYTIGLQLHPRSIPLLRHRGHRFITIRNFTAARNDLLAAARIIEEDAPPDQPEPDGLPNPRNIQRSTLHGNVYYHLAIAAYLSADFAQAASLCGDALQRIVQNDDSRAAFTYWRYLALLRINSTLTARDELRTLPQPTDILENHAYSLTLRHLKGAVTESELLDSFTPASPDEAIFLYGLSITALASGDIPKATSLLERIIAAGHWPAFAAIAAEVDLANLRSPKAPTAPPN